MTEDKNSKTQRQASTMTPEQAVEVLYQMSRKAPFAAEAHIQAQMAADILRDTLAMRVDEEEDPKLTQRRRK